MNNHKFFETIFRKKKESDLIQDPSKDQLRRVLGLFDLIALGIGSTLGLGAYVLAGKVAVESAGPAVVLSFVFAAITSALSGLCYAEFASRVPKAGSAYAFSYVGVGEIIAFLIGWDLIVEYSIGCASIARALTGHIDEPFGYPMRTYFNQTFPMNVNFLAKYPDFFAFIVIMILTCLIAWGMKESSFLNSVFTSVNLLVVVIVVVTGLSIVDLKNWNISKNDIPKDKNGGKGGFLPFGWTGVMVGAASCFYGFVGFDSIATTGEEAKNPTRDIPLAIVISLFIITLAYCSVAIIMTLMWPYYDQDRLTPIICIYKHLKWHSLEWIVTIGAVFALCTNIIGTLFPLPRILYCMSSDGLIFNIFSKVNSRTKTPFWSSIICGTFSAVLASIFDLDQLMDMMSIGTLMAYSLVSLCVLILRYKDDDSEMNSFTPIAIILIYVVTSVSFCLVAIYAQNHGKPGSVVQTTISVLGVCLVLLSYFLSRQTQSKNQPPFRVPCVPYVPCLSIILNIYLMTQLNITTWIRLGIWLLVGMLIYTFYSLRNSVEGLKEQRI